MKIENKDLVSLPLQRGEARKITYTDGRGAYIFQNMDSKIQHNPKRRYGFPPINRNEPMRTDALKQALNNAFIKILELDLKEENCLSLTLTINNDKYNSFNKMSEHFKHFANNVRFHKKTNGAYLGPIRFIEVQEKGFFHIHCILVFNKKIHFTWKELHRMWSWGYVKVKDVSYFVGLIDYLTNFKSGAQSQKDKKFTKYPKGKKVVYICPTLPKAKIEFVQIDTKEYLKLISDQNSIGHIKSHKWFDQRTQEIRTRIDKSVIVQLPPKKEAGK